MTLLFIILLHGYVSVHSSEFVEASVPEYCGKGPVAWCQNFTTSVQCRTTKYCQEATWLTDKPTGSCGRCEVQIQGIRQTVGSGSWNLDVDELTESICNTSESQFHRLECRNSLNQFARHHSEEWLHFLASNVHPITVCHVAGVCSGIESDSTSGVVLNSENIRVNFTDVKSAKSTLFEGCTSSSYVCTNLTASRKCKSTSVCIRRVWSKQQYPEDSACLVCENMVRRARDQVRKHETPEKLRRQLRASCELIFVEKVLRECLRVADNFLAEFAEMLASQMSPAAICTVASLCHNPRIDNRMKARTDNLPKADEPALVRTVKPENHSDPAARENSLCFFCQYLLHFIQEELEKPEEQQKIEEAMNRTCELVPASVQTECQSFFLQNGPLLISLFSHEIDPSLVCPALKICPRNVSRTVAIDV